MKQLTLVKLGGSLITNKSKPFTLKETVLVSVVEQVAKAWQEGYPLIVGHGAGSFAHVPAEKYQTIKGKVNQESPYGAAVVADAASQLNRIVVSELLKQKIPAVSLSPFALFTSPSDQINQHSMSKISQVLSAGLLPVVYGDVILDTSKDYTIWSTEVVLNTIALNWNSTDYEINKVIHTGEPDGFLIDDQVVPEINSENFESMKQQVFATEGFDVTGGMLHKIEESLSLAQNKKIDSYIVGGNHGGNLYRTIKGKDFVGTKVTK